jgi:similar to spore coat protein
MAVQGLALHETLELHELLAFKTVCMTKSSTMQALVSSDELKAIMQQDVNNSAEAIRDLQGLLSRAQIQ